MDVKKPTVIFTTFWDAVKVQSNGGFLCGKDVVRFQEAESNVISVALAKPKGCRFNKIPKLDFFCPSWEMLKAYKKNRDWDTYTKQYRDILIKEKHSIAQWVDSLENQVYILCCWENTVEGAKCHRSLIYDALRKSKRTKDVANYIYRYGCKALSHKEGQIFSLLDYFESGREETLINNTDIDPETLEALSLLAGSGLIPSSAVLNRLGLDDELIAEIFEDTFDVGDDYDL